MASFCVRRIHGILRHHVLSSILFCLFVIKIYFLKIFYKHMFWKVCNFFKKNLKSISWKLSWPEEAQRGAAGAAWLLRSRQHNSVRSVHWAQTGLGANEIQTQYQETPCLSDSLCKGQKCLWSIDSANGERPLWVQSIKKLGNKFHNKFQCQGHGEAVWAGPCPQWRLYRPEKASVLPH